MVLGDLGAEVIAVERPPRGDGSRRFDGHFAALARGSRSICADLQSTPGRELAERLVASADVVFEGMRPGKMAAIGLGYDRCIELNPALVYVSISGYGQTGRDAARAGHDLGFQAAAGLLTGPLEIDPGRLPTAPYADLSAGMYAVIGALTGLRQRDRTGQGNWIDVSMVHASLSVLTPYLVARWNEGTAAPYPPSDPGYGLFETSDGAQVAFSVAREDHLWRDLCQQLGLVDLAAVRWPQRRDRHDELVQILRHAVAARTLAELEELFSGTDVPFQPVRGWDEIRIELLSSERPMLVNDGDGQVYLRQPLAFPNSDWSPGHGLGVPDVGADTVELLTGLGYPADDIDRLIDTGVLVVASPRTDPASIA